MTMCETDSLWECQIAGAQDLLEPLLRAAALLGGLSEELQTVEETADRQLWVSCNRTIDQVIDWLRRLDGDFDCEDLLPGDSRELDRASTELRVFNLRGWLWGRVNNTQRALLTGTTPGSIGRLKELQTQTAAIANILQKASQRGVVSIPAGRCLYMRIRARVMALLENPGLLSEAEIAAPTLDPGAPLASLRVAMSQFSVWLLAAIRHMEADDDVRQEKTPAGGNYPLTRTIGPSGPIVFVSSPRGRAGIAGFQRLPRRRLLLLGRHGEKHAIGVPGLEPPHHGDGRRHQHLAHPLTGGVEGVPFDHGHDHPAHRPLRLEERGVGERMWVQCRVGAPTEKDDAARLLRTGEGRTQSPRDVLEGGGLLVDPALSAEVITRGVPIADPDGDHGRRMGVGPAFPVTPGTAIIWFSHGLDLLGLGLRTHLGVPAFVRTGATRESWSSTRPVALSQIGQSPWSPAAHSWYR